MKRKITSIALALVVNLALLPLSSAAPTDLDRQPRIGDTVFPCCKETPDGEPYCCLQCCYFRFDCFADDHCRPSDTQRRQR